MNPIELDGASLTVDQLLAVAQDRAPVALAAEARAKVARAAEAVETLLARGEIAYGITTGFGAFKDRLIPREQVRELQRNILISHAVGVGEPFDAVMTRAIMLVRANTLARGHSGIRVETLQLLLDLLNKNVLPVIPRKGSLGASGDLAPLAHMALVLIGEGEAVFEDVRMGSADALAKAGLGPVSLAAKEGLALTNGTAVMCALAALASVRAHRLGQSADIVAALTVEALNGTTVAFDERIHRLRPHPQQINCAAYLRSLLAGSELVRGHDSTNVQDAYTLRCIPQVHGAIRDAIAYLRWVTDIELNSVTDNPLIFLGDDGAIEVLSGGNFHGEPLAVAMDYLGFALADLGNISERRVMRLTDEASNTRTLPAFLTEQGGLNSGFMITQYTAAALATENKILAHPASADTIPTSANVEDHVSMGCTSGLKLHQILDNVEQIVGIEYLAAAQGVDFRLKRMGAAKHQGIGTTAAYALIRQSVPFIERDTLMYPHLETGRRLVADGALTRAVDAACEDCWSMTP